MAREGGGATRFPVRIAGSALALSWFAVPAVGDAAAAGVEAAEASPAVAADPEAVEVVKVVGERPVLNAADRRRIYEELALGQKLYADKKVKEAFPYLLNTAERGFKSSQATVGHIYAYGLGDVERDTSQAVGWLGVAADGRTARSIKNYFRTVWQRIPEQHVPYFAEVVEEFRGKYGERATGVVCNTYRPIRTHIKRMSCYFKEDLDDQSREALFDYVADRERVARAAALEEELNARLRTQPIPRQPDD